jgi:hypothetical protein
MSPESYRDDAGCLRELGRQFGDRDLAEFEPRAATERLEEFLDERWGANAPRTCNKNLSIANDFFRWVVLEGHLQGAAARARDRACRAGELE